jgi:RNA polymerase sigma-70 factor (ECF subfamily)
MALQLDAAAEADLLGRARGGSRADRDAAFARIYQAYREPTMALCLHVAGRRPEAEDAVQETFLSVHRALGEFRGESKLSTWIYRIAVREAIRQRARRREDRSAALEEEPAAPPAGNPALRREQRDALARGLDRLSAEHRTVLSLFAIDGLTHQEIAEILGVPEGTVWSRLHAARKRLAAELGPLTSPP